MGVVDLLLLGQSQSCKCRDQCKSGARRCRVVAVSVRMHSTAFLFLLILLLMSIANVIGIYSIFGYDAAHSADILFIVALNLLLWGGVAVLCATLEYNVKVNVFPLLSLVYLGLVVALAVTVSLLTSKLEEPIQQEVFTLVGLDVICAGGIVVVVAVVGVQQRRRRKEEKRIRCP